MVSLWVIRLRADFNRRPDFYEGMCKTFLWPVFHYLALPDSLDKKTESEAWEAYKETNWVYAKKVAEVYKPGDLVRALCSNSKFRRRGANLTSFFLVDLDSRLPSSPRPQDASGTSSRGSSLHLSLSPLPLPFLGILSLSAS